MARKLKAIQCPKCGSTSKEEIKSDYFKCKNCRTEYFLDDDTININENIKYEDRDASKSPAEGKKKLIIILLAVILGFGILIPYLINHSDNKSAGSFSLNQSAKSVSIDWSNEEYTFFLNNSGKPIIAKIGNRKAGDSVSKPAILFIDPISSKEIKLDFFPIVNSGSSRFTTFHFSNGEVFVIGNSKFIFKIERDLLSVSEITNTLFSSHPQMTTGIARVEFIEKVYGEGMKILTNDDGEFYYYPVAEKFYNPKENEYETDQMNFPKAGDKVDTVFQFSDKSHEYPDEQIQLVRYIKKDNINGPDFIPYLSWNRDYIGGGNYSPKSIVYRTNKVLLSWKDFTPERKYYKPKIVYFDKDVVLITIGSTPDPKAPLSLQCLDANTAAINWTVPVEDHMTYLAIRHKDGFLISSYSKIFAIDNNGKTISTFKKE